MFFSPPKKVLTFFDAAPHLECFSPSFWAAFAKAAFHTLRIDSVSKRGRTNKVQRHRHRWDAQWCWALPSALQLLRRFVDAVVPLPAAKDSSASAMPHLTWLVEREGSCRSRTGAHQGGHWASPTDRVSTGAFKQALSYLWPQKTKKTRKTKNLKFRFREAWEFLKRRGTKFKDCKNTEFPHLGSLPSGGQNFTYTDSGQWFEFSGSTSLGCRSLEWRDPSGPLKSCNNTPLRRVLRRFWRSKCFLEGFLEGACMGYTGFLEGFLEGSVVIEGA